VLGWIGKYGITKGAAINGRKNEGRKDKWTMKNWIIAASASNNGNAMPLLLLSALGTTTAMDHVVRNGESLDKAIDRGKGYVLIYALVQQTWTLGVVPHLLRWDKERKAKDGPQNDGLEDGGITTEEETTRLLDDNEYDQSAPEAPRPNSSSDFRNSNSKPAHLPEHAERGLRVLKGNLSTLWTQVQRFLTPPIVGIILAVTFGLIPPLHSAFLSKSGLFYPSLTSSVKNIGDLFTSLQMVALGGQLFEGWKLFRSKRGKSRGSIWVGTLWVVIIRFAVIPVISISSVYFLVRKRLISDDPMIWYGFIHRPSLHSSN
jgi:predicted permease